MALNRGSKDAGYLGAAEFSCGVGNVAPGAPLELPLGVPVTPPDIPVALMVSASALLPFELVELQPVTNSNPAAMTMIVFIK